MRSLSALFPEMTPPRLPVEVCMRRRLASSLSFAGLLLGGTCPSAAQKARPSAEVSIVSTDATRRARALLSQMTLEEKIGQLNLAPGVSMGGMMTAASDSDIVNGRVGAILWLAGGKEINRMQRLAVEKSRLHIPLLFGLDVIHGYQTVFPAPLGMASSWDPAVEEQAQAFAANEARAAGRRRAATPAGGTPPHAPLGAVQGA